MPATVSRSVREQARQQQRLLGQIERLGDAVTQSFVADFQKRAVKALSGGGKVKLSKADQENIIEEMADLMLLGFVRRYRQEKAAVDITLSFSREVAKLARGFDLDLGGLRKKFLAFARPKVVDSVGSFEDRINRELSRITARQQTTAIATRELRRRLGEMGMSGANPGLAETLVRTHAQVAFNAAQARLDADDPDDVIWGYMLSVVGDDRTSDICAQPGVDGFTAPKDDPLWDIWTPPLHWNCRTAKIALTEPAEKTNLGKGASVAPGFDFNPGRLAA
jgi:SPP1 gp7 family putative phage head morphogenesis protein